MKWGVLGLVFLFVVISASATYLPMPDLMFEYKDSECHNGTIYMNLTHTGNTIRFKDVNITVESEDLERIPFTPKWYREGYPSENYEAPLDNYTGTDVKGYSNYRVKSAMDMFTKGKYIITIKWSDIIYYDNIKFAVNCPEKYCSNNDGCISQQKCINNSCTWLKCAEDEYAMGHTCFNKCNDYDVCTKDYYIEGNCTHTNVLNCCNSDKNCDADDKCDSNRCIPRTGSQNILAIFWNWLKHLYN